MNELTVLMMGSPRCGKTSVLASIFRMMCAEPFDRYFNISDQTRIEIKSGELQDSLRAKTTEMRHFVTEIGKSAGENSFLIDASPTNRDWTYRLRIGKRNNSEECLMFSFIDVPGEWCSLDSPRHQEFQEYAKKAQVFVIVVDTPYLMGPTDEATEELCDDNISEAVTMAGVINDLDTVFANVQTDDKKMVVFVPVKCEKWAKEGSYKAISDRIKESYQTTIAKLEARDDISLAIIPMQTIGSIVFSEFYEAKYLNEPSNKCHVASDDPNTLVMADGKNKKKKSNDKVMDDPNFVITGNVLRPSAWYKAVGDEYEPYNCEQLPLHILRFMVKKVRNLEAKSKLDLWDWLTFPVLSLIIRLLQAMFETFDIDELENKLDEFQNAGVIKDNCEGIEYLKDVFEKKEENHD